MSSTSIEEATMKLPFRSLLEQLGLRTNAKKNACCPFYNDRNLSKREQTITPKSERGNGAINVNNADEEAIAALAALPPLEYERQRELQAVKLGCRVGMLDRLVEARRENSDG